MAPTEEADIEKSKSRRGEPRTPGENFSNGANSIVRGSLRINDYFMKYFIFNLLRGAGCNSEAIPQVSFRRNWCGFN
jgi:hypothetical protein